MSPRIDPERPHLFLRLFVPVGAALLVADMALGDPLGGFQSWGWVYFTVVIAVGVSPYVAAPFLVACVALVAGSRLGREALPGQERVEGRLPGGWLGVLLLVAAIWFLVVLIVHLRAVVREERAAGAPDEADDATQA